MIFVKPNGTELEVNELSHDYAISLGWVPKTELAPEPYLVAAKRRGRPPKVKDGDDSTTAG